MEKETWLREFIAGWAGGMLGVFCGHPLDTTKVRQQVLDLRSPLKCLTKTVFYEGVHGIFKGLSFPLITSGVINSIFFGCYQNLLHRSQPQTSNLTEPEDSSGSAPHTESGSRLLPTFTIAAAAGLAGFAQLTVAVPVELVKVRLQTRIGSASSFWTPHLETTARNPLSCLQEMYRHAGKGIRGVSAFYQGGTAQLLRDIPASAAYFVIYEHLMEWHRSCRRISDVSAVLIAGGTAGTLSWVMILPLDAVKSCIQAQDPARPQYSGVADCARKIVSRHGVRSMLHGFSMVSIRGFVVNAATFFGYEYTLRFV